MGTDKAFVTIGGKPLIELVLARVSGLGQAETLLITNQPDAYAHLRLPMHGDLLPEKGSLGGIYTAIQHSRNPSTLAVSCDTPFLRPALFQYMISLIEGEGGPYDVVVPRVENYPQGLLAIYSKACLAPIRERLDADKLNVIGFFAQGFPRL